MAIADRKEATQRSNYRDFVDQLGRESAESQSPTWNAPTLAGDQPDGMLGMKKNRSKDAVDLRGGVLPENAGEGQGGKRGD